MEPRNPSPRDEGKCRTGLSDTCKGTCACTCTDACTPTHLSTCMHVHTHAHTSMHAHTHTCTDSAPAEPTAVIDAMAEGVVDPARQELRGFTASVPEVMTPAALEEKAKAHFGAPPATAVEAAPEDEEVPESSSGSKARSDESAEYSYYGYSDEESVKDEDTSPAGLPAAPAATTDVASAAATKMDATVRLVPRAAAAAAAATAAAAGAATAAAAVATVFHHRPALF